MNCVLIGSDNTAPSTSVTQYNPLSVSFSGAWGSTEAQKTTPISEDMVITRLEVYVDTAPGAAKSYTFTVRDDGANSLATAQISGAVATSAVFTGAALINAGSLVCMAITPAGTPTAPTNIWWNIYYATAGQSFMMMGQSSATMGTAATGFQNPCGANSGSWGNIADYNILIPSAGTMTKLYVGLDGSPGGSGKSYATSVRLNNATDNLTATCSNTATAANASGSVAVAAGDNIAMKCVPAGTPTARRVSWCISITPTTNGETFMGFGSSALPSTTAVNYEGLTSIGNNGWNSTESTRYGKPPAADYKKLYVAIGTAPGGATTRTFAFRFNGADTALSCTITGAATTGNDTTNTASIVGGGLFGSWKATPTGTPAVATGGVHLGYVVAVPQNALLSSLQDLFDQNTLNTTLWDEATALSGTTGYSSAGASMNLPAASVNGSLAQVVSDAVYDLTANYGFLQAVTIASSATSANSEYRLQVDANNWLRFVTENGTIYAQKFVAGSRSNVTSITYNATTHKYWQIREASGTVYFETSSTGAGGSWTQLNGSANLANPFPLTSLRAYLIASAYQVEVTPGSFVFNNYNILPSPGGVSNSGFFMLMGGF